MIANVLDRFMPENWRERIVPELHYEVEEHAVERTYRLTFSWPIVGLKNTTEVTESKPYEEWGVGDE